MVALDILFEVKQEAILVLHLKNVILRIRKMGSGILRVLNIVFELSARVLERYPNFRFPFWYLVFERSAGNALECLFPIYAIMVRKESVRVSH